MQFSRSLIGELLWNHSLHELFEILFSTNSFRRVQTDLLFNSYKYRQWKSRRTARKALGLLQCTEIHVAGLSAGCDSPGLLKSKLWELPQLLEGPYCYLGIFSVPRSAPNQIVCCSLFAMSFANLVHLCYIFSPDYSNWQRPSVQTQTGSRVQGKKLELIQAHFIDHDFLLKHLVWDGHVTRGSALPCFLLYVLQRLPDPQTIFEVPLWMCLESPANKGKTSFN